MSKNRSAPTGVGVELDLEAMFAHRAYHDDSDGPATVRLNLRQVLADAYALRQEVERLRASRGGASVCDGCGCNWHEHAAEIARGVVACICDCHKSPPGGGTEGWVTSDTAGWHNAAIEIPGVGRFDGPLHSTREVAEDDLAALRARLDSPGVTPQWDRIADAVHRLDRREIEAGEALREIDAALAAPTEREEPGMAELKARVARIIAAPPQQETPDE